MNYGAIFVHPEEQPWLLPAVDRKLHDWIVFAVKKEKLISHRDAISIWSEPSDVFKNP